MTDERLIITKDEALSLLVDGEGDVHNFIITGFGLMGCDYRREHATKAITEAKEIEVAGANMSAMRHPIAVWDREGKLSFFEADMDKVKAFEAGKAAGWEWDEGGPHFYRNRPGASLLEPYEYQHIKSGDWRELCNTEGLAL